MARIPFFRMFVVILVGVLCWGSVNAKDDPYQHAVELLSKHPLIDGYTVCHVHCVYVAGCTGDVGQLYTKPYL